MREISIRDWNKSNWTEQVLRCCVVRGEISTVLNSFRYNFLQEFAMQCANRTSFDWFFFFFSFFFSRFFLSHRSALLVHILSSGYRFQSQNPQYVWVSIRVWRCRDKKRKKKSSQTKFYVVHFLFSNANAHKSTVCVVCVWARVCVCLK